MNPVHNVNMAQQRSGQQADTTQDKICALLEALKQEHPRLRAMVLLALTAGLRRGELVALEWSHLDLATSRLTICQTAELVTGQPQSIKPLKHLIRSIMLPEETMEAVRIWQQAQAFRRANVGQNWQENPFVFTQPSGDWMRADEVTKQFRKFLNRHHLPIIPLDSLRNSALNTTIGPGLPEQQTICARNDHTPITRPEDS